MLLVYDVCIQQQCVYLSAFRHKGYAQSEIVEGMTRWQHVDNLAAWSWQPIPDIARILCAAELIQQAYVDNCLAAHSTLLILC